MITNINIAELEISACNESNVIEFRGEFREFQSLSAQERIEFAEEQIESCPKFTAAIVDFDAKVIVDTVLWKHKTKPLEFIFDASINGWMTSHGGSGDTLEHAFMTKYRGRYI